MTRYYFVDPEAENGYVEVSEEDFTLLYGTDETKPYISKVYMGEVGIDAVPAELQEAVQASVNAVIARHGPYAERELSAEEALAILTGGAAE